MSRTIVFVLMLSLFACKEEVKESEPTTNEVIPTQTVEDFVLKETHGDKKLWLLRAEKALSYEERHTIWIYDVNLNFFDENGLISSTLTSDSGMVFTQINNMRALGNVVVVSKEGNRLETETLDWLNTERKIYTKDPVKVIQEKSVMTGIGLESDPNLKHIKIKKDLHIRYEETD